VQGQPCVGGWQIGRSLRAAAVLLPGHSPQPLGRCSQPRSAQLCSPQHQLSHCKWGDNRRFQTLAPQLTVGATRRPPGARLEAVLGSCSTLRAPSESFNTHLVAARRSSRPVAQSARFGSSIAKRRERLGWECGFLEWRLRLNEWLRGPGVPGGCKARRLQHGREVAGKLRQCTTAPLQPLVLDREPGAPPAPGLGGHCRATPRASGSGAGHVGGRNPVALPL